MRNVLIFSVDYFPYVGGAEIAVRETCKRIPDCAFTLITCRNSRILPRHEIIDGVSVFRVGIGFRHIDKYIMPFTAFVTAIQLNRKRRFSMAWAIMANTGAIAAFVFTRLYPNVRYLLTLQEGDSDSYYRNRTWFWAPLYRALHARADHMHVISNHLAARARRFGYRGSVSVIPNGIDPALFNIDPLSPELIACIRKDMGILQGEQIIITTSRLEEKNGIDIFLRAIAIVTRDITLPIKAVVAGSGSEEKRLKQIAVDLGVADSVIFLGYSVHEKMLRLLKASSVFVRPSRSEGLGNSFLEAMACGIPIIGTPVGGIPDFLIDGKTGLFSNPEDPASLADAIRRILSDGQLRNVLVTGGIAAVEKTYLWDSIASKISSMLNQTLKCRAHDVVYTESEKNKHKQNKGK